MPRKWFKKRLPDKDKLKGSFVHRIFGERLLDGNLWYINRRSLAGGVALGVFLAFTPTIPFHMVLAALGAIYFRVNLPVAAVTCWINNPLTVLFIYSAAFKTGKFIGSRTGMNAFLQSSQGKVETFFVGAGYVWLGSLILGAVAALLAYGLVRGLWRLIAVIQWKNRNKGNSTDISGKDRKDFDGSSNVN